MRHRLALAGAILFAAAPSPILAQETGTGPQQAGVTLPTTLDGLPEKPAGSPGPAFNYSRSYVDGGEAITVYVFRAAAPNAALWFERADAVLNLVWKSKGLGEATPIRSFALGAAAQPNGQRRAYAFRSGSRERSTGLVVIQFGDWILKVRSTSELLDVDGQDARLDRIVRMLSNGSADGRDTNPAVLPDACEDHDAGSLNALASAEAIPSPSPETIVAVGLTTVAIAADAAGGPGSLAAAPETWCRDTFDGMPGIAALYRPKDRTRTDWTMLFADSGTSITGSHTMILDGKAVTPGGLVTTSSWDKSETILIAKGVPPPELAFRIGAEHIVRGGPAYASVPYGTKTVNIALPEPAK